MAMIQGGMEVPHPTYKDLTLFPMAKNTNSPMALHDVVESRKPDVVLTIGDYWQFYYVHAVKMKTDWSFKWVGYFTIEDEKIPDKWIPLFRYVDEVAVPSVFGQYSAVSSASRRDAHFIPYGTDEDFKPCSKEKKAELREKMGIPGSKFRLISVGQNTTRKSLPTILLAARILKQRGDDRATFHIQTNVGAYDPNETYSYDLEALVKKLEIEDRISFPQGEASLFDSQPTSSLVEEFQASDAYLCPSLSEGYCLPVVEAMACGLPVMANPSTTLYELLGGDYGYSGEAPRGWLEEGRMEASPPDRLITVMDPPRLANSISKLCDTGIPADMPEACSKWAKSRSWKGMSDSLGEVLKRVGKDILLPVEEF
jgi:glycosyltransferase involved in cell wall biosynthesis